MDTVIQIARSGGPEVLERREIALPPPGAGEVRVRQTEIGVNFVDIYFRSGLYPIATFPSGIGFEAAGSVEAVGSGVQGLAPGDRVGYIGGGIGTYASARNLPADRLIALPEHVSTRLAAASLLRGMTVHMLFDRVFKAEAGQSVLIHAAAGGVGLLAIQWAKAMGLTTIGTVGSADKAGIAKAHGLDHAILYRSDDFVAAARDLSNGGVNFAIDGIGGDTLARTLAALAPEGIAASIGQAAGVAPPVPVTALAGIFLTRPSVIALSGRPDAYRAAAAALFAMLKSGLKVEVGAEFPLDQAARAHALLEGGRTTGSTLLIP